MSSATISLISLYNFDDTLFDALTVPEGIEKQTLIDTILLRGGEFEVLYPDLYFLKDAIGAFSKKWTPTMEKWVKALKVEYNPLENYDRIEEYKESGSGRSDGKTSGTTGSLTTNRVSADDAGDALTTKDAIAVNGSDSTSNEGTYSNNKTNTGRIHVNIGVTTNQMMLKSELDIAYWNIYEKITDLFLTEFVLPIY